MALKERLVSEALKIAHYAHKEDEDQVTIYHLNDAELQYIILHTIEQTIKEGCEVVEGIENSEMWDEETHNFQDGYNKAKTDTQHALRGIIG